MLKYLIIALAGTVPGQTEFETNEVRIRVDIRANTYAYQVTNLSASPLVRFEIEQHASYNFTAPEGWQKKIVAGNFLAWTDEPAKGIGPNKSGKFSLWVKVSGAVLGPATAKVTFQSGQTVTLAEVWAPAREPKSFSWLVAGVILAILLLHTAVGANRRRREQ